jgi:NAD-dependent DNA ligase
LELWDAANQLTEFTSGAKSIDNYTATSRKVDSTFSSLLPQLAHRTPAGAAALEEASQDWRKASEQAHVQEAGATSGAATRLPVDQLEQILVPGKSFCLTGSFLFGTRSACERAVEALGGVAAPRITLELDYLVIGTLASRDWVNTSHGPKIEKAVSYRQRRSPITIANLEQWVQFV